MEPSCSSMYHIPNKVVPDVYMLGVIIEYGIIQQSNPPLVVTEDHSGIQHVSKQLVEELPRPGSFTRGHTRSYVSSLINAQSNRLLLLDHPEYRSKTKREPALRSALAILPTPCPVSVQIIMQLHISNSVSQSMRLCPKDISEDSWHQSSEAQPYMSSSY